MPSRNEPIAANLNEENSDTPEDTHIHRRAVHRLVPGRVKPSNTARQISLVTVTGLDVIRVLLNTVVDTVYALNELLWIGERRFMTYGRRHLTL